MIGQSSQRGGRPVMVPVLCPCGWTGTLATTGACPSCGLDYQQRLTPPRVAILQALARGELVAILPVTRAWLLRRKLIERAGPAPCDWPGRGKRRLPARRWGLTEAGRRAELATRSVP